MADTTNWLRSLGRSRSGNPILQTTSQQQQQQQQQHHHHRHSDPKSHTRPAAGGQEAAAGVAAGPRRLFSPPLPSPSTAESSSSSPPPRLPQPPRSNRRSAAGATLRTVSSFLSLRGSARTGRASPPPLPSEPEPEPEPIRAPGAPLAMLPLTDVGAHDGGAWGGGVGGVGRGGGAREHGLLGEEGPQPTWYNPSVMQMAEMLGAVMAQRGAGAPLPVVYNSCVLSLIEGFYRLTRKLRQTEEQLAELEYLREKELDQFRSMSEEWVDRAEAYQAEIKRLELALAMESKDGVARVALARHGSLVDRAGSKRFQARLKRLSNTPNPENIEDENAMQATRDPVDLLEATTSYKTLGAIPRILDSESDILMSRIVEQREMYELRDRCRQGRVRAAPVLVRTGGDRESRIVGEKAPNRHLQPGHHTMKPNADKGTVATRDSHVPPDNTPRPKAQQQVQSPDSESSSPDSESSTETSSAPSSSRSSGPANRQPGWANKKYFGWPGRAARQRRKEKQPRPNPEKIREQPSPQPPRKPDHRDSPRGPSPQVPKQPRKRLYSFEKGADEILSVTFPVWGSRTPPEDRRYCYAEARPLPVGAGGEREEATARGLGPEPEAELDMGLELESGQGRGNGSNRRGAGPGPGYGPRSAVTTAAAGTDADEAGGRGGLASGKMEVPAPATPPARIVRGGRRFDMLAHSASTGTVRWVGEESGGGSGGEGRNNNGENGDDGDGGGDDGGGGGARRWQTAVET